MKRMIRIIGTIALVWFGALSLAHAGVEPQAIAPDAPDTYTVRKGIRSGASPSNSCVTLGAGPTCGR